MTSLTRRYRFSASHRLHSAKLSDADNDRLYGKCNNPFGHGHDYVLEVTAAGPIDPLTGRVLHIASLDRLIEEQILRRFGNRNLNLDVPEFATLVPTTENVALTIADLLAQHWPTYFDGSTARLWRVHIQETDRNGFEVLIPAAARPLLRQAEMESVHA
jgi:6-pyruvoyltetrahydropterin/6-carboxytetrahydropterin synthase